MSKRALQGATFILALVPVVTGTLGLLGLDDPLYGGAGLPREATLDSNLRFYAGVWLGLGLAALWVIPHIERKTVLFRLLWLMIFIGGIGRIASLVFVGAPLPPFIGFTALEVIGALAFIWWQSKIAKEAKLAPLPAEQ